ncbi:hypothetical protein JCM19379_26390 [Methyloparacoccus murrellii]
MEALLLAPVVQHHVEAAGHGHDQLMQCLVRMPPAFRATGHIVEVIDAPDVEGDVAAAFDEGERAMAASIAGLSSL